jgi:hypothetical protein
MAVLVDQPAATTPTPDAQHSNSVVSDIREWLLKRGVLWGMTQTPLVAILGGVFFHVAPYAFLLLPTLVSFVALPIWIAYRKKISTDPDEPVHHLHKYALWALVPAAMFSVSRIPLHYTIGIIYWHPWYDFGNALTGTALGGQDTLAVGGMLNAIQGWAIGIGFYILFKRHSLVNVLLYVAVWVSALYSYTFGAYSRVGLKSPPIWHASMAWAHWWMALTLWAIPAFYVGRWARLRTGRRAAVVGLGALILLTPSIFAQWRAVTWEFPKQTAIDQTLFSRPNLVSLSGMPALQSTGTDARYSFALRLGPRDYSNWFKQARTLDANDITVTGTLSHNGETIAWCDARMGSVPSPNGIVRPLAFPAALQADKFADIPVTCRGPATATRTLPDSPQVTVVWNAQMTLIGGREHQAKEFTGTQTLPLTLTG